MKTTDTQVERVRTLICAVPAGKVTTYGAVAEAAGLSTPRTVAWILRVDGADLPWFRVIRADGRPAPQVRERQLARLRAEGVPIVDDRVQMRRARHVFDDPAPPA